LQHIFNKEEAARTAAAIINLALHTDNTLNFALGTIDKKKIKIHKLRTLP
jgi:hypothetical protein